MSMDSELFDITLLELTAGHIVLDRLGAPREIEEDGIVRECEIAERIKFLHDGPRIEEEMRMIIKIEQGSVGLWYASTEDAPAPYRGLFLTGNSCAEVLDDLSSTLKHLRELASTITPALDAAIQDEIEHGPKDIMK